MLVVQWEPSNLSDLAYVDGLYLGLGAECLVWPKWSGLEVILIGDGEC